MNEMANKSVSFYMIYEITEPIVQDEIKKATLHKSNPNNDFSWKLIPFKCRSDKVENIWEENSKTPLFQSLRSICQWREVGDIGVFIGGNKRVLSNWRNR